MPGLSTISNADLPKIILKNLFHKEEFCRKVLPFVKLEYFDVEDGTRVAYELFLDFITKYNALPNQEALEVEFTNSDKNVEANAKVIDLFESLFAKDASIDVNEEWLYTTTEKWCQDRAVYLAVLKSINIIDGKDSENAPGAIPEILSKALSVTFDRNVGHDYIDNADERFEYYHTVEEKVEFDLELMNKITKGGVSNKTLNVILAGTGVGKSLAMCHFASAMLSQGKNILYITMEMAEERIAERIDANLFDVDIASLSNLTRQEFDNKVSAIQSSTNGRLIVKEYPTAQAHVGHFRALLNELRLKKDFEPDCIFVDYLNICASSRMKGIGGAVNSYSYVKAIAEEIRGLAVEFNLPIWTATQTNREGFANSDVDLTNTSESFGLPATADLMLALISTEELEDMDQVMVKQLKNRYNDPTYFRKFVLGIDRAKMRLYDTDDSAQDDIMPEINEFATQISNDSDFSSFTVN